MNCTEFKNTFPNVDILALVIADYTYFFRFPSKLISFFMLKFIDKQIPLWRKIFFYTIKPQSHLTDEKGNITKITEKAYPTFLYANNDHQLPFKCVLREVVRVPDLSAFEGKKITITRIH